MNQLLIHYRDGSGVVTKRIISNIIPANDDTIEAYCNLRGDIRAFKLINIIYASRSDTGELVSNIWKECGMHIMPDGSERLISVIAEYLSAIKALKFFTLSLRGFAKREKAHIEKFIRELADTTRYSDEAIDDWLQKLWCGDIYAYRNGDVTDYEQLLSMIPANQKVACRSTAIAIASGSGRRVIEQKLIERINREFS
jgi:hypothetical protein